MVDSYDEDDLFQHTSMTFGEHLEELRAALFKAVIALVIGFVIGLFFAGPIVRAIETPLKSALATFYQEEAMQYVNARVPPELRDSQAIKTLVYDDGLVPEERYVSPTALLDALRAKYPEALKDVQLAPTGPSEPAEKSAAQAGAAPAKDDRLAAQFARERMIRLFLWRPLAEDERLKLDALGVQEPFVIYIKAGFLAGAVLSSPFVFYFLWQFVAAGLYPHEKRYIHVFLPFSLALFLAGAALAFFFVFPPVLGFFFNIAKSLGSDMRPRLSEWLSFVLLLPLGFGISFQLPLVMLFLERIHVFSADAYLSKWRLAVLVIAVVSMVLSPGGDPYSMLMMLGPLVLLYFGGIALCKWLPSPRRGPPAKRTRKA
jgi:sec-independent protein translocase protein TatC